MSHAELQRSCILVVDDEPSTIQLLVAMLEDTYIVTVATDGQGAIDACQRRLPDLVLLDVAMPGLDGYEVCRRLKSDATTCDVPIIFVTAHDGVEDEIKGLEAGAVDFLAKPVRPAIMRARVGTHIALKQHADQLRTMALTDTLTGIANRRSFDTRLELEWRRCRRNKAPLALIMIDIDHFKQFNDAYGHQAGDNCLKEIASALKGNLRRPGDFLGRYGGEEFICLLAETALDEATERADELGHAVERLKITHPRSSVETVVTVSRGVTAVIPTGETETSHLVRVADAMLYAAKRSGRNRTMSGPLDLPVEQVTPFKK